MKDRYELTANGCEHGTSPQCPEPKVRYRIGGPGPTPTKTLSEIEPFDPATDTPVLNAICDRCEEYTPRED